MFAGVDPAVVQALARRGHEVAFPPGAVIFLAGSQPRGWFIVIEGQVRVVRGSGARQHVIHTERAGGTLGEVPLFTDGPYPATAIASEPTRCAVFDRVGLESAIAECPAIAFIVAKRLALRVEELVARLDARSATSVRSRLAEFLLRRQGSSSRGSFSLGMTQQALAEELGTVREVVVRELRKLRRDGIVIADERGRFRIPGADALRGLVALERD
jgi:CRP/FNR family transcriptional regulator